MVAPAPTTDVLVTLRKGLDDAADALARADLDRLLASESQLQTALAMLVSHFTVTKGDLAAMAELQRIRASLAVCRRLGASLTDFIDASHVHLLTDPVTHTFRHSA